MPNVTPLRPGDPRRVGRYRLTGRVDDFAGEGQDVFLAQRVDGETVLAAFPRPGRAGDAAAPPSSARPAPSPSPSPHSRVLPAGAPAHTLIVMLENHNYSQVIGRRSAPFLNGLAKRLVVTIPPIAHPGAVTDNWQSSAWTKRTTRLEGLMEENNHFD